ncbi:tyrosine-type recombinase/integrase [Roseateles sp. DB2]|uniref:tyrosine-type recombinase/integrase n=1 Tax=Roseateles sp. DB2 TaxID=3453717 RepID=UPI003EE898F8
MTLDRFVAEEVNPHNKVRKRSHARDLQLYKRIGPRFGHCSLMDIRRKDVQDFHNALVTEERLSPASADHHVTYMRRILNLAVQWEFIEKNVLTKIPLMKVDNKVERYLTEEETSRLIEVLQRDKAGGASNIFLFLLSTGARLNEAMSAKWEQMDLASEIWRVPASNSKSKRSRVVPLNESAVWVLNQLDTKGHHDFLFVNPATNRPFVTITRAWYRLRRKAGIENMRIHDLRHSYASFLANANCSLYEIQNILGHSDPRVTQRYAHLQHQTLKNAARAGSMIVRSKGSSAVA